MNLIFGLKRVQSILAMTITDFKEFIAEIVLVSYGDVVNIYCWNDSQKLTHLKICDGNIDIVHFAFPIEYLDDKILFPFIKNIMESYKEKICILRTGKN